MTILLLGGLLNHLDASGNPEHISKRFNTMPHASKGPRNEAQ
jgi:hypothetical protein